MKKLENPKFLFSVKGYTENYGYQLEKNHLVNWLADKIFVPDFMEIYKENENLINSYHGEIQNLLLDKIFTFQNLDLKEGEQTDIFLKNIYNFCRHNNINRFNYVPQNILNLNLELLSLLETNINEKINNDLKFIILIEVLKGKYAQEAFEKRNTFCINKVFQYVDTKYCTEVFIDILGSLTYFPVIKDASITATEVPMLWAFLCDEYKAEYPFSKRFEAIRAVFLDIDNYKNKMKERFPNQSKTIDTLFCDELKAYVLMKIFNTDTPDQILDLLDKGYGEAFEEVNGYSFYNYAKSSTNSDRNNPFANTQQRFEAIAAYYDNKTPEFRM